MKQKVYYYNEKLNALISREDIKYKLLTEETTIVYHRLEDERKSSYLELHALDYPRIETYVYSLTDIPFNDDWVTIVIDEDLTLTKEEYVELFQCTSGQVEYALARKLLENVWAIKRYEYKGIKIY